MAEASGFADEEVLDVRSARPDPTVRNAVLGTVHGSTDGLTAFQDQRCQPGPTWGKTKHSRPNSGPKHPLGCART
jgi:hypothetical protein